MTVSLEKGLARRLLQALRVCLALSVVCNIGLSWRTKVLSNRIDVIRNAHRLQEGATVAPFEAKDLKGKPVQVAYAGTSIPTVLYVISPKCIWCARNEANIRSLADHVGNKYRIVGISTVSDDLAAFVAQKSFPFPIYTDVSVGTDEAYHFGGTPQTIVISPTGKVLKVWTGAFSGSVEKEVEGFFGLKMPGLVKDAKAFVAPPVKKL